VKQCRRSCGTNQQPGELSHQSISGREMLRATRCLTSRCFDGLTYQGTGIAWRNSRLSTIVRSWCSKPERKGFVGPWPEVVLMVNVVSPDLSGTSPSDRTHRQAGSSRSRIPANSNRWQPREVVKGCPREWLIIVDTSLNSLCDLYIFEAPNSHQHHRRKPSAS
jgi:hypothetical protein